MTVADVGEFGLIARVTARLGQRENTLLGPGDDAAVLRAPDGRVVATTDLLVEDVHFRRDWSAAYDVGRRAAAQNFADVAAMGGVGTGLLVGLCCPPDLPLTWADGLMDGLRDEAAEAGADVVGGDVVRGERVVLAITALGDLQGVEPVRRDGARAGDVVALAGRVGWAAAGLAVLTRGGSAPEPVVDAYRRPRPPYAAGPVAARAGATAMCDVSDGLLADLGHIADASGVSVEVQRAAFEVPAELREAARELAVDPLHWLLTGGEDHALVAAFPPAVELPTGWRPIGTVGAGSGVLVDGAPYDRQRGFDHFE